MVEQISYAAINFSLLVSGGLVVVVLMVAQLISNNPKTRQNKIFTVVLILMAATMLCDTISWCIDGIPGAAMHSAVFVFNYLTFLFPILALLGYTAYIEACVALKTNKQTRVASFVALLLALTTTVLISIPPLQQTIFVIDELNHFAYGTYYVVILYFALIYFLIDTILIIRFWRHLGTKDALILLSYVYIPMATLVVQSAIPELVLIYPAMTMALLIIYVTYQSQINRQLREEAIEYRIAAMMSQIQPHFLYNSLTVIENLCIEDPSKAREASREFADYLRANLESLNQKKPIPFAKELSHTMNYLSLEQKRFGKRLSIKEEIKATDFLVPSLSLQPIVENAVRHGISKRVEGGTVTLITRETETSWQIIVEDDGVGYDPALNNQNNASHIGLKNVQSRLAALCNGMLSIEGNLGKGTVVTMSIPKEQKR